MAGFGIEVKVTETASQGLLRLAAASQDLRPAFVPMIDHLERATRRRFDTETSPSGTRWKANSPRTKKFSIKKVLHGETLMLRDLFEHQIDSDGFAFGSNRIYARIQQLGGQTGRGHRVPLVAREYLGVNADDLRVFDHEVVAYMRRVLG
jgi:phage virion morphogenesis protein